MLHTKPYSGVELSLNQTPTGNLTAETSTWRYQEFFLPTDAVRGTDSEEERCPDATGFQVFVTVREGYAATASLDYTLDVYDIGVGYRTLASGTVLGCHDDGQVWMDVYFDESVPLIDTTAKYRIGFRGRTTTPLVDEPIDYDATTGVAIIESQRFEIKLQAMTPTALTVGGVPGILVWDDQENEATFSHQYGVQQAWYTTPNPLNTTGFDGATPLLGGSFNFRLLTASADSGRDFLGNPYRSVAVTNGPSNVTTVEQTDGYWLSKPNPSKFAVESLYFDVSDFGRETTTDSVFIDPITPGVWAHVYYSSEGDPADNDADWARKLWTPAGRSFLIDRKDTYVLPVPVTARYLCLEFSHLQAQSFQPGPYQRAVVYQKHPKWVLDYFLLLNDAQKTSDDPFLAKTVSVAFDALDLAYSYYVGDLKQAPDDPSKAAHVDTTGLSTFFNQASVADHVDPTTLAQINLSLAPFLSHPALRAEATTLLGQVAMAQIETSYPVESEPPTPDDVTVVSSTDRDAVLLEQGWPVMSFYIKCRHYYRQVLATFEYDRAYFAGVREIAFQRQHYSATNDDTLYLESTGDNTNAFVNDFVRVDNTWVIQ